MIFKDTGSAIFLEDACLLNRENGIMLYDSDRMNSLSKNDFTAGPRSSQSEGHFIRISLSASRLGRVNVSGR